MNTLKMSCFSQDFNELLSKGTAFDIHQGRANIVLRVGKTTTVYTNNPYSKEFFQVARMLKNHVLKSTVQTIEREYEEYYISDISGNENVSHERIGAIDINSAYPTVLRNDGIIDEAILRAMNSLKKTEKLAVIGMLAHRKKWKHYEGGQRVDELDFIEPRPETSRFFFHCVNRISDIMFDVKSVSESFLFTWVDCIYIHDLQEKKLVQERIKQHGFDTKNNVYTDFLAEKKRSFYAVSMINQKAETVTMTLPKSDYITSTEKGYMELMKIAENRKRIWDNAPQYLKDIVLESRQKQAINEFENAKKIQPC